MHRFPIVRHLRYLYYRWRHDHHTLAFGDAYWTPASVTDEAHLADIWHGRA
jgi:hypothetical protein